MTRLVIVPNSLRDAIEAEIDLALAGRPITDEERRHVYSVMLEHFDRTGDVPSIDLEPTP